MTAVAPTSNPRTLAQAMIDGATKKTATFDNMEKLILLIEQAEPQASARDIADLLSSNLGANVPWDRGTNLGFRNLSNLLAWRDCFSGEIEVTISHAFAAVSMKWASRGFNAAMNHSADIVDGVIKGVQATRNGKQFSMAYGYGKPNQLGDYMGNILAAKLALSLNEKLSSAFRSARKAMQL